MTDLANAAAVVSAGYTKTQVDYGAGKSPRYATIYDKYVTGDDGQNHDSLRAIGTSDVSAAAADTQATACLNGMRNIRYGAGATANSGKSGKQHTFDNS